MNLNKYHSSGRLYTSEESARRAASLFIHHYLAKGYSRTAAHMPEVMIKPYANEAKRQARMNKSRMLTTLRRGNR